MTRNYYSLEQLEIQFKGNSVYRYQMPQASLHGVEFACYNLQGFPLVQPCAEVR